jgi:hypothetical protein
MYFVYGPFPRIPPTDKASNQTHALAPGQRSDTPCQHAAQSNVLGPLFFFVHFPGETRYVSSPMIQLARILLSSNPTDEHGDSVQPVSIPMLAFVHMRQHVY